MDTNPAYFRYWGKAVKPGQVVSGAQYHLLPYHSLDVAAVGQVLLQQHPFLRKRLATLMGVTEEDATQWCIFLLGIHDLGKFAESFQQLRGDLRQTLWPDQVIKKKNYSLRHDSLGEILWQRYLKDAWLEQHPDWEDLIEYTLVYWLQPVLGHHGKPPVGVEPLKHHFTPFDQEAALSYLHAWHTLIAPRVVNPATQDQAKASWLLAGIAVLCDWLGSNQTLFRYQDQSMCLSKYWHDIALPTAEKAVLEAGLLPKSLCTHQGWQSLFPSVPNFEPTPLQAFCATVPISAEPQLFILEDVTGAGKTEAALMLAHRLMSVEQAEGLYIGLPTMATANAMYERMVETYLHFYAVGSKPSLILSHSARHLSEQFQTSLLAAQPSNQNYASEENISAQCNRWLADNRKKALLADVGIGTIDQALLGVMPARHQSLRLLGLANKVLILDEIHAYDAYTSELLKNLVAFHAALGGSVILLSATLTRRQREDLIHAFHVKDKLKCVTQTQNTAYPLLTRAVANLPLLEQPLQTRESVRRSVQVQFCHNDEAIKQLIQQATTANKSVCWIRNTVSDAREAYEQLAACEWVESDKLYLFHSRYTLHDRLRIEGQVLAYFGKDSTPEQRNGCILVATQVVEQSLDLDFDVMISDLAPIDLLIQRAGRLQRHTRDAHGNRLAKGLTDERGTAILSVFSPPLTDNPSADWFKQVFPKADFVYPHTVVLWRTAQCLARKQGWAMPDDARELLEFVYDGTDDAVPPALAKSTQTALGEGYAKRDLGDAAGLRLKQGYTTKSLHWDEEAKIATRLGDESQTVYLARWQDGVLSPWCNEGRYCWDLSSVSVRCQQVAKAAKVEDKVLAEALKVLIATEQRFDGESVILPLLPDVAGGWYGNVLDSGGRAVVIRYNREIGLWLR